MPKIIIDLNKCDGCHTYVACAEVCPLSNYEVREIEPNVKKVFVIKEDYECLGCKKCEPVCPMEAILITD